MSSSNLIDTWNRHSLTGEKYSELTSPFFYETVRKRRSDYSEGRETVRDVSNSDTASSVGKSKIHQVQNDLESCKHKRSKGTYTEYVSCKDKLFWYLMMVVNDWDVEDLPIAKDRFAYESNIKTGAVEMLQNSTTIPWKELKVTKGEICTNIACGSGSPLSLAEFSVMAHLYEKNFIVNWGRCFMKIHGGRAMGDSTWNVVVYEGNDFRLVSQEHVADKMKDIQERLYEVSSLQKPMLGIGSYKLSDLQTIAVKLDMDIHSTSGKLKKKQELYDEITSEVKCIKLIK